MQLIKSLEDVEVIINATMNPDYQLSDKKECKGISFRPAHVIQTNSVNNNGEECVCTTFITAEGTSYQTLSNFYDRLVKALVEVKPEFPWTDVEIENAWKLSKNGRDMLAPKFRILK